MKAPSKKTIFCLLFSSILLLALSTPLLMYFSHDVAVLNTQWPHKVLEKDLSAHYLIKQTRPKMWIPLKEMSTFAKWSIILSEDWAFYQHEGIDVEQIKTAFSEMITDKRYRGASTITQQMVKNVFLSSERTLWRKIHEMILSYKVEKTMTKQKILEVYLNVIEFGPAIYGIGEASQHYFKKHPSGLTPKEGAFLAMLLPSPKRYYESYRKRKLTAFARSRIDSILSKLRMKKVITQERYDLEKQGRLAWEQYY
jgi:monofunctional glycosyltransferase